MATPAQSEDFALFEAGPDDLDDVMLVMDSAFGSGFGEAWTRSQLTGILPMDGVSLIIARAASDGTAAGFSLARSIADESELLLIAVHPEFQCRGAGGLLLADFLRRASDHGLVRVHLEVRDGNPASNMYLSNEFKPIGRRRNYYRGSDGQRHDAVTLARDL